MPCALVVCTPRMKSMLMFAWSFSEHMAGLGVSPEYTPTRFVCQIFTTALATGAHALLTTRRARRTGRPVQPSETSTRARSLVVVHGPAVVDETIAQAAGTLVNGFG